MSQNDTTLGGYFSVHDRPPAWEGSDGHPYTVSLETEMLQRLHHAMEGDAQRAKAELLQSVSSIRAVFDDRSIKAQIREIEAGLATNPEKISYQKRVLKVLRKDAARAASPSWGSRLRSLFDRWTS